MSRVATPATTTTAAATAAAVTATTTTTAAAAALGDRFDSWESIANNYLSGRILWLTDKGQWTPTPDPSQQQFQQVADDLLADPTSPWNRVSWDRSAGVMVDGERLA